MEGMVDRELGVWDLGPLQIPPFGDLNIVKLYHTDVAPLFDTL